MKKLTKEDLADLGQYAKNGKWSQTGEDGILLHLFACLGVQYGTLVDIGAGDGWNLSNARLLINHGWNADLFDGNPNHVGVTCAMITYENVNAVLDKHRVPHDLDLLSLDIDGQDWWVWRAIDRRPKVVVVEVNGNLPAAPAVTIPRYTPFVHDGTSYYGASFSAFVQLGRAKGYTLVHNQKSLNLFFVRNDLIEPGFAIHVSYAPSIGQPPDELKREWHYVTDADLADLMTKEPTPAAPKAAAPEPPGLNDHGFGERAMALAVGGEIVGVGDAGPGSDLRIEAAMARGEAKKAEFLAAEGGCLTAEELARLNGKLTPKTFTDLAAGRCIIAVEAEPGVWKYPRWQFTDNIFPLAGLERILRELPADPWGNMIFFLEPNPLLGPADQHGEWINPIGALRAKRYDDVLRAAKAWRV